MLKPNKIIVVGGNAAGPAAAAKAKRVNPEAEVILYEAGNFISTGTCELPYVLAGEIADYRNVVFFDDKSFYEKKGVKVFLRHTVTEINPKEKFIRVVNLDDNSEEIVDYDSLVLTTGSKARMHPALTGTFENVFTLKSVGDYLKIKNYIDTATVKNILIIGGSYIGLESAEAFKKLGFNLTIIDLAGLPIPNAEEEISNLVLKGLQKNNVRFVGGVASPQFIKNGKKITGVKIGSEIIETDMVLVSMGVVPNNSLAVSAKLETGKFGGLRIDKKCRTSNQFIFAAGDNMELQNRITGKYDYIPLATYAHEYGHTAGANAAGANYFVEPVVRNSAVKLFDDVYASAGLTAKEAERFGFNFGAVSTVANNLIGVMPASRKIFGKLIFEKGSRKILGASFLGGAEVPGLADLISAMILKDATVEDLAKVNYNYTPPNAPFVNILSILSRKAKGD